MKLGIVILAAGLSRRMGTPKMLLPWGKTSVLGQVTETLYRAAADAGEVEMVIVCGGARPAVEAEAARLAAFFPLRTVFNPEYESGEMMSSIRVGLAGLSPLAQAALIALGDQPQLSLDSARGVVSAWEMSGAGLVIPSFANRRGHPWLAERALWGRLGESQTARAFLQASSAEIYYTQADESVLKDLDTPADYAEGLKNIP